MKESGPARNPPALGGLVGQRDGLLYRIGSRSGEKEHAGGNALLCRLDQLQLFVAGKIRALAVGAHDNVPAEARVVPAFDVSASLS